LYICQKNWYQFMIMVTGNDTAEVFMSDRAPVLHLQLDSMDNSAKLSLGVVLVLKSQPSQIYIIFS
jgi:hypothetical protein